MRGLGVRGYDSWLGVAVWRAFVVGLQMCWRCSWFFGLLVLCWRLVLCLDCFGV